VIRGVLKPWLRSWFRWTIHGLDNIPRRGPAILAFNHISYLDPFAAAYAVDEAGRQPRFLAKAELFHDARTRWLVKMTKQIEVRRGTPHAPAALGHALAALRAGDVIVIFPEGTITRDPDLKPLPAKNGVARLALAAGVPVTPCAVWGTANVWAAGCRKRWWPRQDVAVRIGTALPLTGDPDGRENWRAGGEQVMEAIADLTAALRPSVPDLRRPRKHAA